MQNVWEVSSLNADEGSSRDLINRTRQIEIKKIQDTFCKAFGIYACCMGRNGEFVTEFSGNPMDVDKLRKLISDERIQNIFNHISGSDIEDQVVEITHTVNIRLAAVSVRSHDAIDGSMQTPGDTLFVWIIMAVLRDVTDDTDEYFKNPIDLGYSYTISSKGLENCMDLLRSASDTIILLEEKKKEAVQKSVVSSDAAKDMSNQFKRADTMAFIVNQLDSDAPIEEILNVVIEQIGNYLGVSNCFVCKTHKENHLTDIIATWNNYGHQEIFDKTKDIESFFFLRRAVGTNNVLSYNATMTPAEHEELRKLGIKAIATFPVMAGSTAAFYICICETSASKVWDIEEIKFISDSVRILQNIITRRIQKNSLASSFASLEAILDNVGSSIFVRDITTGTLLFANRSLRNHFSKELREGTLESIFGEVVPKGSSSGNYEVYHKDRCRWYDLYFNEIKWVDGKTVELFAIYDVTEKKIYQNKIEQQAYTDFLTGLYNRMCCERDLSRYIDEAKEKNLSGAILYLDLDDFKHINDGLGHQYGDILLKNISKSLCEIDGIHNTCYRMGGDEFVIIVPISAYPIFNSIVENIKKIFSRSWFLKDADYYCTMSMGIVEFPSEGSNVEELIKKADIAMYDAKKSGKNRIARYSDSKDTSSSRRLDMEKNMHDAMLKNYEEFEVYFQPVVNTKIEGTPCTGAEALIRWNSKKLGFISPAEFIPLAEYIGLINPIGNHVLDFACKACKKWNDEGHPDFRINVNLSVVQLLQSEIVEIISTAIEESGISPKNLVLEITESLAINDLDRTKTILSEIKKLGVAIALDDFGTGYSSLNNIRALPFDIIKVDQNFVKDLADDAYSQSFIRMIAELGEAIGADICVEGIETANQLKVLKNMKVKYIQGYYFDKPLPMQEFEDKYISFSKAAKKKVARTMDI